MIFLDSVDTVQPLSAKLTLKICLGFKLTEDSNTFTTLN
jgi:hypothetical protein